MALIGASVLVLLGVVVSCLGLFSAGAGTHAPDIRPTPETSTPTYSSEPFPVFEDSTPPEPVDEEPFSAEPEGAYYANCKEMRKDFPNGVKSDHEAYRSALDRDDDGRACER